ncbi:hypothetical protein GEMRC1_004884 [Eukaryota sp. GEM-RC1]
MDEAVDVRSHCMKSFAALAKFLKVSELSDLIEKYEIIETFTEYMSFLRDISSILREHFFANLNSYIMSCLQSTKADIEFVRANSALVAASIVSNLSESSRKKVSVDHAPMEILSMLKDSCSEVRTHAALALALFKDL